MELGLSGVIFLQFFSLYDLFHQWEGAGVFDIFLPALLIFTVIYGILSTTGILGSNRGVSVLIAGVVAVMALRTSVVSDFFTVIFPQLGIGLAIILVGMILSGLFIAKGANLKIYLNTFYWVGFSIAVIIAIVTLNRFDWFGSFWWQQNWVNMFIISLIILVIWLFLGTGSGGSSENTDAKVEIPIKNLRG
jgi:hypothetical protein